MLLYVTGEIQKFLECNKKCLRHKELFDIIIKPDLAGQP